jgi:peptidoglycan hydrolase-like protein with peptidoglycan-binding domain
MINHLDTPLDGVLRLGSHGSHVRRVQHQLNDLARAGLHADGAFGLRTLRAVRAWQVQQRFVPDGRVDQRTAESLGFSRYVQRHPYRALQVQAHAVRPIRQLPGGPLRDLVLAAIQTVNIIFSTVARVLEPLKRMVGTVWDTVQRLLSAAQMRALQALDQLARWVNPKVEAIEATLRRVAKILSTAIGAAFDWIARSATLLAQALAQLRLRLAASLAQIWRVIDKVLSGAGGWAQQILAAAERAMRKLALALPEAAAPG